jgi:hypothetical protein
VLGVDKATAQEENCDVKTIELKDDPRNTKGCPLFTKSMREKPSGGNFKKGNGGIKDLEAFFSSFCIYL